MKSKEIKQSKVPFEILSSQVEMLFSGGLKDDETIDQRLEKIENFIEACGWTQDEYETHKEFGYLN